MSEVKDVYAGFLTSKLEEEKGKWLEFGALRVRVARSGGSNKRFKLLLEAKTRPYQRAIKNDMMDNAVAERIMREVFAETIVTGWETKDASGEFKKEVLFLDGTRGPAVVANFIRAFEEIPELFNEVQLQAGSLANFRDAVMDANAGNSSTS